MDVEGKCQLKTDLSATVCNLLDLYSHFVDVIETRDILYSLNVNWAGICNGEGADYIHAWVTEGILISTPS